MTTDPPILTPEEAIESIRIAVASVKHDDYADGGRATYCSSCGEDWDDLHNCPMGFLEKVGKVVEALRAQLSALQTENTSLQLELSRWHAKLRLADGALASAQRRVEELEAQLEQANDHAGEFIKGDDR